MSSKQPNEASEKQSQSSSMSPQNGQQPQQATEAIAIDMKLFKEKMDLDCRIEIYKQAFPEMNRVNLPGFPRSDLDRIWIMYEEPCIRLASLRPPSVLPPPCQLNKQPSVFSPPCQPDKQEGWNCIKCEHRSYSQIHQMLASNFVKDKDIRSELLQYYFRFVQFAWAQCCERSEWRISILPKFFEAFQSSGLTEQLKHLTLDIPWKYTGLTTQVKRKGPCKYRILKAPVWSADDSFRSDLVALSRVFGVLYKYKIKAELIFPKTYPCRLPFIKRVEELCKTRLQRDGPEFWKQLNAQEEGIFRFDAELRRLVDEAVATEYDNRGAWATSQSRVKYNIDFS